MRRIFALGFFVLVTTFFPYAASAAVFEVSGWIPYWRAEAGTADVLPHLSQLTEINPFSYSVTSDGVLSDTARITEEPWVSFITAAKKEGVRVVPTVMWSDAEAMHRILSNQKTRIALEDEITKLVKDSDFDGIEIDFEGKYAETKDYFSTFLRGLYIRIGQKWVVCDIEPRTPLDSRYVGTPPAGTGVYANDYVEINKYCDRVKLMTYDQGTVDSRLNSARTVPYMPLSDPWWVEKVVLETAKTIKKSKIIIGIPTYGYEYEVVPRSQYGYTYEQKWAFNPRYATKLAEQLGVVPKRNGSNEISFVYTPTFQQYKLDSDSNSTTPIPTGFTTNAPAAVAAASVSSRLVWWSDAKAIADKVALAKRLGVRGVAIFKMDGGEDQDMWSVLR